MNFKTNKQLAKELYNTCINSYSQGDRLFYVMIGFCMENWKEEDRFGDILAEIAEISTTNSKYHLEKNFKLIDQYVDLFLEEFKDENLIEYALEIESAMVKEYDSAFALFIATSVIIVVNEIESEEMENEDTEIEKNDLFDFCVPLKGLKIKDKNVNPKNSKPEEIWKPKFRFEKGGITQEQHEFNMEQIRILIEDIGDLEKAKKYVMNVMEILEKEINKDFAKKYLKMILEYSKKKEIESKEKFLGGLI